MNFIFFMFKKVALIGGEVQEAASSWLGGIESLNNKNQNKKIFRSVLSASRLGRKDAEKTIFCVTSLAICRPSAYWCQGPRMFLLKIYKQYTLKVDAKAFVSCYLEKLCCDLITLNLMIDLRTFVVVLKYSSRCFRTGN